MTVKYPTYMTVTVLKAHHPHPKKVVKSTIMGKHSGTWGCHLLQDLKVPASNLDKD